MKVFLTTVTYVRVQNGATHLEVTCSLGPANSREENERKCIEEASVSHPCAEGWRAVHTISVEISPERLTELLEACKQEG